uniref:Uncharacterized protein n=1 Tax=Amphimedon queenslandica TaxID=400682 RepID=A0A1X7T9D9_AMPQE
MKGTLAGSDKDPIDDGEGKIKAYYSKLTDDIHEALFSCSKVIAFNNFEPFPRRNTINSKCQLFAAEFYEEYPKRKSQLLY